MISSWTGLGRRALLASTIGLGLGSLWPSDPVAAESMVRFGASLPLTGRLAPEGKLVKDGYDFAVRRINDLGGIPIKGVNHKIAITYYDDESDPKTATKLVERLIVEDKVDLLLGPYGSGATLPASSVNEKYGVPMVVAHGAATAIYDRGYKNVFATLTSIDQYLPNIVKMAGSLPTPPKGVAIMYENSVAMQLGAAAAAEQAKASGLTVVYNENYPTGTTDMSAMLADIKSRNAEFLVAAAYTTDAITIARQAREMGLKPKMQAMILGPTLPAFKEALGAQANYLLEPVQWTRGMTWKDDLLGMTATQFYDEFKKEYGYDPDYHPPQSAAAVLVFYHAIKKAGTLEHKAVRDAIAQTDIMTFYGPIRFNEKGQNIAKGMAVVQVQDGKPVVVYPKEFAEGEFIYPIPASTN